ncbi:MAG TPA: hypothetical protein VE621_14785 [Bryobacteraceae bacterium]|nr:hypothetical protein [Bryobacteraceae bacterium]
MSGLIAGVAVAVVVNRFLETLLYDLSPYDPAVFAGTTIFLLTVSMIAVLLPGLRATRLSPVQAVRYD